MLYLLTNYFGITESTYSFLRLFNYISFRSSFAFMTAFLLTIFFGRRVILFLYRRGMKETSREEVDLIVQNKKGTPTMGGVMVVIAILTSSVIWCDITSLYVLLPLAGLVWFGMIGLIDDRAKISQGSSDVGLSRSKKIILQALFGVMLSVVIFSASTSPFPTDVITNLYVPFLKSPLLDLGYLYYFFAIFILVAISNAVNFADGLDGLAIVPMMTTISVYGLFAYIIGSSVYSNYLLYQYMPGISEITVLSAAIIGAGLGFLWFNAYPAQVFMGDTGSQALGGVIATIAILTKQEFLFLICGGVFLAEAVSVLIQDRIGIARVGRRFFFRAPLHHTFQFRGLPETTVVVRFWIISILLALMSVVTIKLR